MLTTPITTPHFHSSVLSILSSYNQALDENESSPQSVPLPLIPALTPDDTPLTPSDTISQLLAVTAPWIDLASPDPVIAHLSRQVFNQEVAYAAFCGVVNVIVEAPKLHHGPVRGYGIAQFARAVQEALSIGPYLQVHVLLPMIDSPEVEAEEDVAHLSHFAKDEYIESSEQSQESKIDLFGTWDAWNIIRRVCKYNPRLSVGKQKYHILLPHLLSCL